MKNICIAGANGLIGRRISAFLSDQGYAVRWLVRKKEASVPYVQFLWEPNLGTLDFRALEDLHCLINLSGSPIAGSRWTKKNRESILSSRLGSIEVLSKTLHHHHIQIPHIIQASAIGLYGHQEDKLITESDVLLDDGFLSTVCQAWENKAQILNNSTSKLTIVRTGLYFDPLGGIWPKLLMTKNLRILNYFGSGEQVYSWIHFQDYNNAIGFILEHPIEGPINLCAPGACTMNVLMHKIQEQLKFKTLLIPVPSFLLYAVLGESAHLVLDSTHVYPKKLMDSGFKFDYQDIDLCIQQLVENYS